MLKSKFTKHTNVGSWDVETGHAVVARNTVGSQNVQNTPGSDHFWKFKCRKSARRCGTKHISTTKLLYTTLHKTRLHYTTQHYITLHSLHRHKRNCNHTTLITLHHNYNSTTLQLQLQLNYTTIDPAVVGEVTDQVNTATIVTTPKKQLQPPFSPSVDSLCHPWFTTTNLSYRFPIFETSATALCGTTRSRHYCAGAPFENWSCHPKEAFFVTTSVSLNTHTQQKKQMSQVSTESPWS